MLGFEFRVDLYPCGTGAKVDWLGKPKHDDGYVPELEVFVRQNPDLGPEVPRCAGLKGYVVLNGSRVDVGSSKHFEEVLRPELLTSTSWAPCFSAFKSSVTCSSLFDNDMTVELFISEVVLQDGTVLT